MNRRNFVVASAGAAGLVGVQGPGAIEEALRGDREGRANHTSALKLSVSRWPYRQFTLDQLSKMARELGLDSVELLEPDEWAVPRRYGLTCAMGYATVPDPSTRLTQGFKRGANH